jgi:hypothetical protein
MRRMPGWISRADRMPVYLCGSLSLHDGQTLPVTITDLSPDGCKVCAALTIGEVVQLDVPGRDTVRANVRWSILGKSGLLFIS